MNTDKLLAALNLVHERMNALEALNITSLNEMRYQYLLSKEKKLLEAINQQSRKAIDSWKQESNHVA
jgi:hypothetical protein